MEFKGMDELMEAYQIKKLKKSWYWPVTSTIYKMILGAVLGAGVAAILLLFWPFSDNLGMIASFIIAIALYISLWKRDWL